MIQTDNPPRFRIEIELIDGHFRWTLTEPALAPNNHWIGAGRTSTKWGARHRARRAIRYALAVENRPNHVQVYNEADLGIAPTPRPIER